MPGLSLRGGPNPFRGATTLRYTIAEAGAVEVALFDAAGRLVIRFDEGVRAPGAYTIGWDGRSRDGAPAPPGVYFARATSRGVSAGDWIVRLR
jgi:hypothetical protein